MRGTTPYRGLSIVRLLGLLDGKGNDIWLYDPGSSAGGAQKWSLQLFLHQAWQEALELLQVELGADMAYWTWGRLNRVYFTHPMGDVKPQHLPSNQGRYPMQGD